MHVQIGKGNDLNRSAMRPHSVRIHADLKLQGFGCATEVFRRVASIDAAGRLDVLVAQILAHLLHLHAALHHPDSCGVAKHMRAYLEARTLTSPDDTPLHTADLLAAPFDYIRAQSARLHLVSISKGHVVHGHCSASLGRCGSVRIVEQDFLAFEVNTCPREI